MKRGVLVVSIILFALLVNAQGYFSDVNYLYTSLVNQDPDPVIAGDVVEVRVSVENQGGQAADDVVVELVDSFPFSSAPGDFSQRYIGTVRSYQVSDDIMIVKFDVLVDPRANEGKHLIRFHTYAGDGKVIDESSFEIEVKSQESAEIVFIDKVQLLPGEVTPMTFTINNVGSAPIKDLTFYWENQDEVILPVGSDDTKYIKYLDIGASEDITYKVVASANADPDLYKLDIFLTYDDPITGERNTIETGAGVYVGGETDFDVTFSGSSKGETSFSIANIGSVPADSVTVTLPEQQGWKIGAINSVIIGNLNKGDYTIATFNINGQSSGFAGASGRSSNFGRQTTKTEDRTNMTRTAAAPDKVTVEIHYTDTMGNRRTVAKQVAVEISSATTAVQVEDTGMSYWWYVLAVVVFVAAYFGWKRYRPKKKR